MDQQATSIPYRTFGDRAARMYRAKLDEMAARIEAARASGDETSIRSYENLASGWRAMIKHAERARPELMGPARLESSHETSASLD